jgi:preprotein translocase subunit SecG
MFYNFLLVVHCGACVLMILVVLLQTGRGAGLAVFGGGGDSLINTPSGSTFMKNVTAILAGTFAFTSLFLTLLSTRSGLSSVTSQMRTPPPVEAPVTAPPGAPAPAPAAAPAPATQKQKPQPVKK